MFKKIVSICLAALLLVGCFACLASCGEEKAPETAKKTAADLKVALICLHGTDSTYDKNFIDSFKAACAAKGISESNYRISTGVDEKPECYDAAADYADEGYDIVFADSFGHEPYMLQAAQEFPDTQFCHATGTNAHTANVSNFQDAFASIYEGRYLAGVAGGLKLIELYGDENGNVSDENAKVGYVGAWPYAEVISGYTSFYLGVKSVVPNATMQVRYTNSWYHETAEKLTAQALIADGCKLISQHADSMGAPTACEEAGIPNVSYNGVTGKNSFVIASKIDWQPYFEYCIDCVLKGEDIKADYTGTIETGSVQITALGTAAAAGTQEKLDAVKADLVSGALKVFDCSKFTVKNAKADTGDFSKAGCITMDEEGHLTAYLADVDDFGDYIPETNVIRTENGVTYFAESALRSAPYFDVIIDGISIGAEVVVPEE